MINFQKKFRLLAILMSASITLVNAQVLPLDPAVRTGKLSNGFTYYIRHNEEPKNRVVLYLANKVGSILETDDQQGLAHFMEHMSFNGTKHFPKNELVNYLQKSGVRFGADLNAYTSFDETVYQLPLPTDKPEILASGLQIMRDWAQEATLDPTEIDKERGVVLEEKRSHKDVNERFRKQYFPMLLNGSRYSNRMPIGTDEVLNNFKPATIRQYYHDWYRPDLQALIVVGDIDPIAMEKTIKAKFGDLKNPVNEKPRVKYTVPLTGKNQFMALTDPEMAYTVAQVIMKRPEEPLHSQSDYRGMIQRQLMNLMLAGRIQELSQQAVPSFLQAQAGTGEFLGGLDEFEVMTVAKPGELETGFKAIWRETERAVRFGFTQTELERAKASYLNQLQSLLKEKAKTNSEGFVREYLAYFLKGNAAPGINKEYSLSQQILPAIQVADVNATLKTCFKDKDRDVLIMAPEKEKANLPNEQRLLGWISAVKADKMEPYQDKVSALPLLSKQPVAGKVTSESKDPVTGITTLKLSNGITVQLKPTNFKDNQILFNGFSYGGSSQYSDKDFQSANAAADLIASFGAGNYTASELQKYLSGKNLKVDLFIGELTQGVEGSAEPKDLETALQLLYAYYTEPRKDSDLFRNAISRGKAGIANRSNNPASVFKDTVSAVLGNYSVRKTGPTLEKINQIDLDRAYQIYQERFGNSTGAVFTFIGSFDPEKIKPLLEKYLGALPVSGQVPPTKDLGIHPPEGQVAKTVYKGSEPRATVQLVWSGTFNFSTQETIALDALKECLYIRLLERLREEESGVYSPSASARSVKFLHQRYTVQVLIECGPQNVEKLISSTLDEIAKLKASGPPQVNVDKWRAESLRQREVGLTNNGWWQGYLNDQTFNKEDLSAYRQYESQVTAVTPEMVKEMAQKYLSGKNYIRLVLLPDKTNASQ